MARPAPTKSAAPHIARTLDRGLVLLETLAAIADEPGVTELAERCDLDKSTAHRLLATLAQRGYVQQNPRTRGYALGTKILELYDALQQRLGLQETCRPFLARLVELTGETSHLAVLSGKSIVFVDWFTSPHMVSVRTQIGRQEPVHCTALGQAMLAFMSREDAKRILDGIPLHAYTPATPTTPNALLRSLDATREAGFAIDDEEFLAGVRCVAAPVLRLPGPDRGRDERQRPHGAHDRQAYCRPPAVAPGKSAAVLPALGLAGRPGPAIGLAAASQGGATPKLARPPEGILAARVPVNVCSVTQDKRADVSKETSALVCGSLWFVRAAAP